jgi:tetratricopeptide (TPR) repeat protein
VIDERLAELEQEREFLLRSLADLEREHEAGDVDEHDYATLRDGYTARAAATLREIESRQRPAAPPSRRWGVLVAWVAGVVVLAVVAGVLVARFSGERLPGQNSPTGGVGDATVGGLLSDPVAALDLYQQVLTIEPDNVEAITYTAWLAAAAALQSSNADLVATTGAEALADLRRAQEIDPTYPDAHCFSAIVLYLMLDDPANAQPELDTCLASNPPQEAKALAEALGQRIQSDLDAASSSTSTTSSTP